MDLFQYQFSEIIFVEMEWARLTPIAVDKGGCTLQVNFELSWFDVASVDCPILTNIGGIFVMGCVKSYMIICFLIFLWLYIIF